jgi:tyrosinase
MHVSQFLVAGVLLSSTCSAGLFGRKNDKEETKEDDSYTFPSYVAHPEFKPHPRDIKCTTSTPKTVRREWRMLSIDERTNFITNMRKLYTPAPGGDVSFIDRISQGHVIFDPFIHGTAAFFPWHRWLLRHVELKLQEVSGDPKMAIPYWSTSFDSQGPELAPVFGDEPHAFGRNGNANSRACITTGGFKDLVVAFADSPPDDPKGPHAVFQPHCLRRRFHNGKVRTFDNILAAFITPEVLSRDVQGANLYREFRAIVESSPHGLPHLLIGGDMSGMTSPNDPLFFLHHSEIDRLWYVWQNNPKKKDRATNYNDDQKFIHNNRLESKASSTTDKLIGFEHVRVADVMDSANSLCVTYEELDVAKWQRPYRQGIKSISLHRRGEIDPTTPVQVTVEKVQTPVQQPAADDRTNLLKLRLPPMPGMPEFKEWIKKNHLDFDAVNKLEQARRVMVEKLNNIVGYVSEVTLWNQPNKLAKLPTLDGLKARVGDARAQVTSKVSKSVENFKDDVERVKVNGSGILTNAEDNINHLGTKVKNEANDAIDAAKKGIAKLQTPQAITAMQDKVREALKVEHVTQNSRPEVQAQVEKALGGKLDFTGWFSNLPASQGVKQGPIQPAGTTPPAQ